MKLSHSKLSSLRKADYITQSRYNYKRTGEKKITTLQPTKERKRAVKNQRNKRSLKGIKA